ncbi:FtsQ-type POTRA domain-containing protein [Streptomyces sp. ACA25]|uniref:cell division protein FtsQ/DivIB n=1 Tax=Streptomyces sp. ACA25 TaxID=3022596 RepID=UPI0023071724|nr:FtsQ-type POTRA domain-containing protein [Streptomyces sp. ACA25]MDB1089863.1 FtsQ-type POTRA domain-containing protein [Streptomyces sp. ACA25]
MAGPVRSAEQEREPGQSASVPPVRRRLPRRALLALLAVLAATVGGFGSWALYGSDWLRIERVSVSRSDGPRELTEQQIEQAAGVPLGAPMATLDKARVRDRLLKELPRVKSVDVVRAWPSGVSLKVTEREPEVFVPTTSGYTEVDAEGVGYAEVAEAAAGVPLLELDLESGASLRRFGEDRIRTEAVAVAAALPESLRARTAVIRVRSYDAVVLELSGGVTVRWGSAEQSAAKAEALTALMKAVEDAEHFDVSVPSAPAASAG